MNRTRAPVGTALLFTLAVAIGGYFTFSAVQGENGILRRVQIVAETEALRIEATRLEAELARLGNLTARLSDAGLDPDLLDERARDVLGYLRADEVVLR
jgi:cell division protein FtsB